MYPEENVPCHVCGGGGGWLVCLSSAEWCEANPMPGRESVARGTVEWFDLPACVAPPRAGEHETAPEAK